MKDLERWEFGNPEHVAIRREKERAKNPAMLEALKKARVREALNQLFEEPPKDESSSTVDKSNG